MRFGIEAVNQLARYANSFRDIQVAGYCAGNDERFAQCHVISGHL